MLGSTYRLRLQPVDISTMPETEALRIPGDVFGTINDLQPVQNWTFDGREGTAISLRLSLTSGDFTPVLMLWGSLGQLLAEGVLEDMPGGPQLSISGFTLPQDGRYRVTIGRRDGATGTGSGGYHFLLRESNISSQAASATDIPFDNPVSGFLYGVTPAYYAFQGEAGDTIAISASVPNGDTVPQLRLETEAGDPINIPVVADTGEAYIPFFLLPKDDRYVVMLESEKTTQFTLTITRRNAEISPSSRTRNLGLGQLFLDAIDNPAVPTYWLFSGRSGEVLSFTADTSASGLRADIAVYGPHGYLAGAVETTGVSRNVSFGPVRLPDTGNYFVMVQPWLGRNGGTTGRYSLLVTPAESGVSGSAGGYIPVKGMTVSGGLISEDPEDVWTFDGQAGEVVSIGVQRTSGDGSLSVLLLSPGGSELSQDASDNADMVSIDQFSLPDSGPYRAVVQGQAEYRLEIVENRTALAASLDSAQTINYGQTISATITTGVYGAWTFWGQAGERVEAETSFGTDQLSPRLFLLSPDGHVVFMAHTEAASTAVIPPLVLPETGSYGLVVLVPQVAVSESIPMRLLLSREQRGVGLQGTLSGTASGELSFSSPVNEWAVSPAFPGHYLIRLESLTVGNVPDLFIKREDGTLITQGTINSNGQNDVIVLLEGDQLYTAVVSNGPAVTRQEYTIALVPASVMTNGGLLNIDVPDVGRIDDFHLTDEWSFDIDTAGPKTVEIRRTSGNLIPAVSVYDPNKVLIKDVQAGEDGSLTLAIEFPGPGRYALVLSRTELGAGSSVGDYMIEISSTP